MTFFLPEIRWGVNWPQAKRGAKPPFPPATRNARRKTGEGQA